MTQPEVGWLVVYLVICNTLIVYNAIIMLVEIRSTISFFLELTCLVVFSYERSSFFADVDLSCFLQLFGFCFAFYGLLLADHYMPRLGLFNHKSTILLRVTCS